MGEGILVLRNAIWDISVCLDVLLFRCTVNSRVDRSSRFSSANGGGPDGD